MNGQKPIQRKEGDHTIKTVAAMINQYFDFGQRTPTTKDIERQLQSMTELDDMGVLKNSGAKRNKIVIEIKGSE